MSFFGDIASGLSAGVSAIGRGISSAWENVGVPVIRDIVLPAAGQALGAQVQAALGPRQIQQQVRTAGRVAATQMGMGSTAPAVTQPRISRTHLIAPIDMPLGTVRSAVQPQGFASKPAIQPAGLMGGLSNLLRPEITEAFGDIRRGWCETFPESKWCPAPGGSMSVLPGGVAPRTGGALVGQTGAGMTTPAFQQTPGGGVRPARIINTVHPISGRIVWWRNMGRPILWSGDLSSCARVNRIASRAKRVSRGARTARKKGRR